MARHGPAGVVSSNDSTRYPSTKYSLDALAANQALLAYYRDHPNLTAVSPGNPHHKLTQRNSYPYSYSGEGSVSMLNAPGRGASPASYNVYEAANFHESHVEYNIANTNEADNDFKQSHSLDTCPAAEGPWTYAVPPSTSSYTLGQIACTASDQLNATSDSVGTSASQKLPDDSFQSINGCMHYTSGPRETFNQANMSILHHHHPAPNTSASLSCLQSYSKGGGRMPVHPTHNSTPPISPSSEHSQSFHLVRGNPPSPSWLCSSFPSVENFQTASHSSASFNDHSTLISELTVSTCFNNSELCRSQESPSSMLSHSRSSTSMAPDTGRNEFSGRPLSTPDSYKNSDLIYSPRGSIFPMSNFDSINTNASFRTDFASRQSRISSPPSIEVLPPLVLDSKSPTPSSLNSPLNRCGSLDITPILGPVEEDGDEDMIGPLVSKRNSSWFDEMDLGARYSHCPPGAAQVNPSSRDLTRIARSRNDGSQNGASYQKTPKRRNSTTVQKANCRGHACPQCPRTFRLKKDRNRHLDIHYGTKYVCDICDKQLARRDGLQRHMRNLHPQAMQEGAVSQEYSLFSV